MVKDTQAVEKKERGSPQRPITVYGYVHDWLDAHTRRETQFVKTPGQNHSIYLGGCGYS
jgi:hypothetical protein